MHTILVNHRLCRLVLKAIFQSYTKFMLVVLVCYSPIEVASVLHFVAIKLRLTLDLQRNMHMNDASLNIERY